MQFGFHTARVQGYLTGISGVWMGDELPPQDVKQDETKAAEEMDQRLALCCLGCAKCAEAEAQRAAKYSVQ